MPTATTDRRPAYQACLRTRECYRLHLTSFLLHHPDGTPVIRPATQLERDVYAYAERVTTW